MKKTKTSKTPKTLVDTILNRILREKYSIPGGICVNGRQLVEALNEAEKEAAASLS